MPFTVTEAVSSDLPLLAAIGKLVRQLSRSSPAPDGSELDAILASPASRLLVAREGDRVLGMLTLVVFRIPTGVRALVEDVVVDDEARGQGVGESLTRSALDLARALGARTVDLTSRPSRAAANRLYLRVGFEPRETNVYRAVLQGGDPAA